MRYYIYMRKTFIAIALSAVILVPAFVLAGQSIPVPAEDEGTTIGLGTIETLIEGIVDTLVYVAGFIVVGYIIYAGLKMVMSRGDATKFAEGKKMLINGIIGALVIFGVGVIVNTIANVAKDPGQNIF